MLDCRGALWYSSLPRLSHTCNCKGVLKIDATAGTFDCWGTGKAYQVLPVEDAMH